MAPGIVRDVGDVAQLASLCAPKRLVIAGGRAANGKPVGIDTLRETFRAARPAWEVHEAGRAFSLLPTTEPAELLRPLR
jgi:hypothetical protein